MCLEHFSCLMTSCSRFSKGHHRKHAGLDVPSPRREVNVNIDPLAKILPMRPRSWIQPKAIPLRGYPIAPISFSSQDQISSLAAHNFFCRWQKKWSSAARDSWDETKQRVGFLRHLPRFGWGIILPSSLVALGWKCSAWNSWKEAMRGSDELKVALHLGVGIE